MVRTTEATSQPPTHIFLYGQDQLRRSNISCPWQSAYYGSTLSDEGTCYPKSIEGLATQVHDFLWQIRVNDDLIDFKMYDFLRDWMNDHLQRTDKEYALFLFSRGVR